MDSNVSHVVESEMNTTVPTPLSLENKTNQETQTPHIVTKNILN